MNAPAAAPSRLSIASDLLVACCDDLASDGRYAKKTRALATALKVYVQSTGGQLGTFTYNQVQDPRGTHTVSDGETWLVPNDTDGYYDLWVYSEAAGGWTNQTPPHSIIGLFDGVGTSLVVYNNGRLHATGIPETDPGDAGAIWSDNGTLKVSAG